MTSYLWDAWSVAFPFLLVAVGVIALSALHDLVEWVVARIRRWRA